MDWPHQEDINILRGIYYYYFMTFKGVLFTLTARFGKIVQSRLYSGSNPVFAKIKLVFLFLLFLIRAIKWLPRYYIILC